MLKVNNNNINEEKQREMDLIYEDTIYYIFVYYITKILQYPNITIIY